MTLFRCLWRPARHTGGRSLLGGIVALVENHAEYCVDNNTVYAANGAAETWSPTVEYASDVSISNDSVKNAVSK